MSAGSRLRRRYVALAALVPLAGAAFFPVIVLLVLSAGHSIGEVGLLFAVFSVTCILLEVPSGSVADVFGRRRAMLVAACLDAAGCALLAVAEELWEFGLAFIVIALARSLGSGVLESWYVDELAAAQPGADYRSGVAAAETGASLALGAGALAGGVLPWSTGSLGSSAWLGVGCGLLLAAAVAVLMDEGGREPKRNPAAVLPVLVAGLRAYLTDRRLTRVFGAALALGVAISVLEVVWPAQLVTAADDGRYSALIYGIVLAASAGAGAVGIISVRWMSPNAEALGVAVLSAFMALMLAGLGMFVGTVAVASLMLLIQWSSAGIFQLALVTVHRCADGSRRATVASVLPFAARLGGVLGALLVLAADSGSVSYREIWLVVAILVAAAGSTFLGRAPVKL